MADGWRWERGRGFTFGNIGVRRTRGASPRISSESKSKPPLIRLAARPSTPNLIFRTRFKKVPDMHSDILALSIEFIVQTAFLVAGLWIMIKLQKLDYNWLGLLGAAALGSGLDMIP